MKNLTQRLANALRNFFRFELSLTKIVKKKHQDLKRRAFASQLHLTFRQLEPRRVLSVNSNFAAGVLTINIVDDAQNTNAALLVNGANFFADHDGNQTFDAGETTGLLTALQQITVNGAAGVGSFAWRGDFTASNALQDLLIQNVSSTTIDSTAVLQNNANITAEMSITFGSNSNLTVSNDLTANVTANLGQITNSPSASLRVVDAASLSANAINLGLAAGDSMQFGSLTLISNGSVQIAEDTNGGDLNPGTRFVGANTVGSIDLTSDGSIQVDAGSSFAAITSIGFQAIGLNSDIQINGSIQSTNGSVNLQSTDSILFGTVGSVNVSNAGNVVLTANSDALDGNGSDGIFMSDGSSIQVAGGTIQLRAENAFGGDITLGLLAANTNAGTAIDIRTLNSILDGTVAETANLSATNGAIVLLATNGAIGAGAAVADIDINAIRLAFNAPGVVQLTDLAGGIAVTGASTAGGGGFLAANSPLTISANVNVGASMVFTAGNSALAGDNLTIDSAAIVTLNSAVAGTLTFEAGDDIVFNTGRIVTMGGGIHSVVLSADLDNTGVGAADGDRGSISQDGTASVEVTTDNLTANAATGINIDTTVTNLTASNTVSGGIGIRETDGISLTSVVSTGGSIDVTAAGLVTATSVTTNGVGSNVTIATTTGGIAVTNVTAANNVVLSATAGDITSGIITGTAGSVGITATNGDVTIGAITAGTTVTIATPLGSINDAQNDAIADITAGGLITLTARDEIAGLAADGRLDLAAGSDLSALSNLGNILLRGIGALTLTNVATLAGFIDVLAQGTITAINVDASGTDTNLNDVTLVSTAGDVRVGLVQAGPVLGDVIITAQNNIFDNDIGVDSLDVRGNDVTLTATTGSIGSTSTEIFRENVNAIEIVATGNLTANAPLGLVAIDAVVTGTTSITAVSGWVQSNGNINTVGQVFNGTNLALIADADNNGVGTLNLDNTLAVFGDLRVEGADIVAADGSIDLTANRLMVYSGQSETLNVTTTQLDATTNGNLIVSANGSIELIDLGAPYQVDHNPVISPVDRDNIALQTLSNSGFIQLDATGSITVSDDVIAGNDLIQTSTGTITLRANAINANVNIKDTILSDAGAIVIEAFQDINVGGLISPNEAADTDNLPIVTTTTGNITLRADSDGTLNGAGGAITMADGTPVIAGRDTSALYNPGLNGNPSPSSFSLGAVPQLAGSAEIRLFADGTIALGSLQSANVGVDAISVQSFNGAITDNTAAETSNLITTGTATLTAALGIGAAAAADIDTTLGTLVATNSTSGSIFIQETNGLIIGGTGVRTLGGNGNINIDVDAGNLTTNSVVTANGSGTVTLNADAGTIDLNAAVSSTTGAIVLTGDAINQNAGGNITTGGAGTVTATADNGSIAMADGTTTTTANGAINYSATGNVVLSQLISTNAAINVTADSDTNGTGAITDNSIAETSNLITTGTATLVAAQGIGAAAAADIDTTIGTLIATNSTSGSIFVQETNGLIIAGTGVRTLGGNGDINVDVDAGNLTVNSVVTANGSGTVTLNADAGTIDLNAAVSSTTGSITVTGDVINQNAGGNIVTGGAGTVTVTADNGNITMADGTTTTTANGAINYNATNNVALSQLISTDAPINVTADSDANASGAIVDNTAAETPNLITTGTATLTAALGIGAAAAADIDTTLGTLVATNSTSGSIFIQETNGLIIGGTGVRTLGGNGNINIDVIAGNLAVNSVVTANGAGTVLLQTLAASGDIVVNAVVQSGTGHISLLAGDDVDLNSNIATGGTGTVSLSAANTTADAISGVDMAAGTNVTTAGGNARVLAQNNGDIRLGLIDVSTGNVSLIASRSILDANGALLNIAANNLRMVATNGTIGEADPLNGTPDINVNAIDTQVSTLAASSATGIYVREANGVTIDNTVVIGVQQVNFDATTAAISDASLEDLTTTNNGPIKLQSLTGDIVVNSGSLVAFGIQANGTGDILLQTQAANGDIVVNGVVRSGSGHISLSSGDEVDLNSNIVTSGLGSIYLLASNATADALNGIDMAAGTSLTTAGGNVRLMSQNNGDIQLGLINAGAGNASLVASRSVLDANGAAINVIANSLRMVATNGSIGEADSLNGTPDVNARAIDTQVAVLSASSATGMYFLEVDGVAIDNTGALGVQQVNFNSTTTAVVDASVEDLTTSNNGPIKLQSLAGDIVVNPGTAATPGIQANGTGDILLQTLAANGDIIINSAVLSQSGHITQRAGDDVDLNSNISTIGTGTVYLLGVNATADAISGVDMAAGTSVTTAGGNVRVLAQNNGDIQLGLIDVGSGNVSLGASRSILDANGVSLNIAANNLRMEATAGTIGTAIKAIDTQVSVLAARSATGIFVFEANGVRVDNPGDISIQQANFNSTGELVTDTSFEDLQTTNGTIHLRSAIGDIVINAGSDAVFGVNAGGPGNDVILQVEAVAGPQSGNIVLRTLVRAADDVTLISRGGSIDEGSSAAMVQGDLLTIEAGQYAHLHNTLVNQLDASVGSNAILNAAIGQVVNANASDRGDDFLDNLLNITGTSINSLQADYQFATKYMSDGYSLFLVNQKTLEVTSVMAGISAKPNVYIETSGNSNLNIAGQVITNSSTKDEGGVVLVAGGKFALGPAGSLVTQVIDPAFTQTILQTAIVPTPPLVPPGETNLGARFFDGGQGIELDNPLMTSTQFVIPVTQIAAEKFDTHVQQRVALQFGTANEAGFAIIIGYADGKTQLFDTANEQFAVPANAAGAIKSSPSSIDTAAAVFTRADKFDTEFLNSDPVLPTNAIIRRSSDFFILENASKVNGPEVKDLTFEYKPILNVFSRGISPVGLPPDLPMAKTIVPGTFILPVELSSPIAIQSHDVELEVTVDRSKTVTIYRVNYDDDNNDGQPGLDELPSEVEVLESIKKQQDRDDGFEITSASDGTPTQQEIDAKKAELIRDPQRPSGAYAIVEKDPDGNESVIEVFPIRDWEDVTPKSSNELPLVPSKEESADKLKDQGAEDLVIPRPMPKDSSGYVSPPNQDIEESWIASTDSAPINAEATELKGNSRFASLGLFFGSLWIVRETTKTDKSSTDEVLEELGSIGFSSRDRRNRRLRSKLSQ